MGPPAITFLYQYTLAGAVAIVLVLAVILCIRARFVESRRPPDPTRALDDLEQKPRLYDAYLDGRGELWHEIMPVSLHPVGSGPHNPAKNALQDVNPPTSALLTVTMITMPSPDPPLRAVSLPLSSNDSVLEEEQPLPHLEFGVTDVEVPREIQ